MYEKQQVIVYSV